ncbi:hypothetical protein [Streptococcus dysgalactiae]|nr:hypothetical protein [Streptococcus dysgalactiae]
MVSLSLKISKRQKHDVSGVFVNGFKPVFLEEKNKKTTSYAGG